MRAPDRRPVWREPMLWLVAGMPLAVLVAAAVTVALARRTPADASAAQVRRIAQVQLEDLAPDREAARRGLQATLQVDPVRGGIQVTFAAPTEAGRIGDEGLELQLLHPVDAGQDRRVSLRGQGLHWHAQAEAWPAQDWEVRLQPPRGEWRLTGRLRRAQRHAVLAPAVAR